MSPCSRHLPLLPRRYSLRRSRTPRVIQTFCISFARRIQDNSSVSDFRATVPLSPLVITAESPSSEHCNKDNPRPLGHQSYKFAGLRSLARLRGSSHNSLHFDNPNHDHKRNSKIKMTCNYQYVKNHTNDDYSFPVQRLKRTCDAARTPLVLVGCGSCMTNPMISDAASWLTILARSFPHNSCPYVADASFRTRAPLTILQICECFRWPKTTHGMRVRFESAPWPA